MTCRLHHALLTVLVSTACSADMSAPLTGRTELTGDRNPDLTPVYASLASAQIDTSDSFFRIEADLSPTLDVNVGEPVFNPATGGTALHAESPPVTLRLFLEGGYLPSGETLVQGALLEDGVTDPQPDDPAGFRFVNDQLTLFDRRGWLIPMTFDDVTDAHALLTPIGSLRDVVFDLTGGMGEPAATPEGERFSEGPTRPTRSNGRRRPCVVESSWSVFGWRLRAASAIG